MWRRYEDVKRGVDKWNNNARWEIGELNTKRVAYIEGRSRSTSVSRQELDEYNRAQPREHADVNLRAMQEFRRREAQAKAELLYERRFGKKFREEIPAQLQEPKISEAEVKIELPRTQGGRPIDYSKYDLSRFTPEQIEEAKKSALFPMYEHRYLKSRGPIRDFLRFGLGTGRTVLQLPAHMLGEIEEYYRRLRGRNVPYDDAIEKTQELAQLKIEELKGITARDRDRDWET